MQRSILGKMETLFAYLLLMTYGALAQDTTGSDNSLPLEPVYNQSIWAGGIRGWNFYGIEMGYSISKLMMTVNVLRIGMEQSEAGVLHRPRGIDAGYNMYYEHQISPRLSAYVGAGLYGRMYTYPSQENVTDVESYSSTVGLGARVTMFSRIVVGAGYTTFIGDQYKMSEREQEAYENIRGFGAHLGYRF